MFINCNTKEGIQLYNLSKDRWVWGVSTVADINTINDTVPKFNIFIENRITREVYRNPNLLIANQAENSVNWICENRADRDENFSDWIKIR